MRSFLSFINLSIWLILSCLAFNLHAQDVIYPSRDKGSIPCKIDEFSNGKVYFFTAGSSKIQKLPLKKVALVLETGGKFSIPTDEGIRMNAFGERNYDLVFGLNGDAFAASEVSISQNEIRYTDYNTGSDILLTSDLVAGILYKNNLFKPIAKIDQVASAVLLAKLPRIMGPAEQESMTSSRPNLPETGRPDPNTTSVTRANVNTEASDEDMTGVNPDPITEPAVETADGGPVVPVDINEFQEKARSKVKLFANYVEQILESDDNVRANQLIRSAISLFVSDSCTVEVSNVRTKQNTAYPVRRYLNRLKLIRDQYSRIEVSSGEFLYVSDLRKQGDKWYATVSFAQRFSGYVDNVLVYTDKTVKSTLVELRVYEPEINGVGEVLWDVLISDIKVEATSL